jgi:hypothetical protein
MESAEARKLRLLVAELDRLCSEAQEVREKIDALTHQPPLWPERREHSEPAALAQANDSRTPELHGRKN